MYRSPSFGGSQRLGRNYGVDASPPCCIPPNWLQHSSRGRLHADRKPVDARPAQRGEVLLRQIVGIGLERRLLRPRAVEQPGGMRQKPLHGGCGQQRGGSAAEIAGAHRLAVQIVATGLQFAVRAPPRGHPCAPALDALVKIAVGADTLAERYVKIDSGHRRPVARSALPVPPGRPAATDIRPAAWRRSRQRTSPAETPVYQR